MKTDLIKIYLADHSAMMTAELELILRCQRANENESGYVELTEFLKRLHDEVDFQKHRLRLLLKHVGGRPDLVKEASGWLAEKIGRLKLNGGLTNYSSLSRVLELEALISAASARKAMWSSVSKLSEIESSGPELVGDNFVETCTQQIQELERFHQQAAIELSQKAAVEQSPAEPDFQV